MIKSSQEQIIDELDKDILRVLQTNGRISNVDLAEQVNLSPPAVYSRVQRLQRRGYIKDYVTILDREKLGFDMLCFISVSLQLHQFEQVANFPKIVHTMPEVLECHHLTGEYDYLLKVVIRNRKDLQQFVVKKLTPIPGVAHIHTSLVLTEIKSTTTLPM